MTSKPKWRRLSDECDEMMIDNIKHGAVCRDFRGDWVAIFQGKPLERGQSRAAAKQILYRRLALYEQSGSGEKP